MFNIEVPNVNLALPQALALLRDYGRPVSPRGKLTYELPGVMTTTYTKPRQMVLFDSVRDANPFFHFFEALWILAGRQDVAFLSWVLPRMAEFSDDGHVFHAPYGYRLRYSLGFDQIEGVVIALRDDMNSRQAVLTIWDPARDLGTRSKDIPCNDMIMLKVRDGALRMTVCNRSNDVIWGAYGANVVQFSTLLVYLAGRLGVGVGTYTQVSDSFHVYEDNQFWLKWRAQNKYGAPVVENPYTARAELVGPPEVYMRGDEIHSGAFDRDLKQFFKRWDEESASGQRDHPSTVLNLPYETLSFRETVIPMFGALVEWKHKSRAAAFDYAGRISAPDWRMAAYEWMDRRMGTGA